jgi:hypothetical protein
MRPRRCLRQKTSSLDSASESQSDAAQLKRNSTFAKQGNRGSRHPWFKPLQFKPPIKPRRENHCTPEKFRMECVWENLLRRCLSAATCRKINYHLPRKLRSGFRLRAHSFAALRITPANRLDLELAKGFEPPTL